MGQGLVLEDSLQQYLPWFQARQGRRRGSAKSVRYEDRSVGMRLTTR